MMLQLRQSVRLRLGLQCTVCKRLRDETQAHEDMIDAALTGAMKYAICPCCRQKANALYERPWYRRRVDAFLKRMNCPSCGHPWTMHSTDPTTINRCSFGDHLLGCRCENIAP